MPQERALLIYCGQTPLRPRKARQNDLWRFLLSLERFSKETGKNSFRINSICKFEFVDGVKSKNIDQNDSNLVLELFTIEVLKNKENFEINLIFSDNAYITLATEIVEVTLEDQTKDL